MKKQSSQQAHDRGGPVNLTGVHYQLLTTFQEMSRAVRVVAHDEETSLTSITLVIEPVGGGDSVLVRGGTRQVHQIKSHRGKWSLNQIVARVLPDLFRAFCNTPAIGGAELITNGHLDAQAQGFCEMLDTINSSKEIQNALEQPTGEKTYELPWFKGRKKFGDGTGTPTLADLIDYIVERLSTILQIAQVPEAARRERVKSFLGCLSLRVGISFDVQEDQCRKFLQGWGIAPEAVSGAVDQAVGYLLRRGRHGDQAVTFSELVLELGLAQQDLSNWSLLCGLSRERLLDDLARSRLGYNEAQDVRRTDPLSSKLWVS